PDEQVQESIQYDLFGNEQKIVTVSRKERKIKEINNGIRYYKREIKRLTDSLLSGKDKAMRLAKQLTDWNPYDQNVSSPFFDPEWMFGINEGFDIVIANPPYVVTPDNPMYDGYKTKRCYELYAYFYEKALMLLKENGVMSFITASLYVKGLKFQSLRDLLEKSSDLIKFRIEGDSVFDQVGMPTATIILTKSNNNPWTFSDLYADGQFMKKIESFPSLKSFSTIMRGYEIGRNAVTKSGGHPIVTGTNVQKWIPKSMSYITDDIKESFSKDSYYFEGERVLIRETGSSITTLCLDTPLLCTRSLYSIKLPDGRIDYKYLTGVLNSLLIQYYYTTKFKSETELFPKIRIAQVKEIPIPIATEESQQEIHHLVDKILEAKSQDIDADVSEHEAKIDQVVYSIYGLSFDDVLLVDPNTSLTREEYEKAKTTPK
ncbi:MAG: Eco57I restriction-modification methylase domain-containing protein, partial [Lachnospiraceae bacterium]|nr:Eco57I restriction-modification methylase domain-containing protein [Lachnospiraceae bacterium]